LRGLGTSLAFNSLARTADSQSPSNGLDALIEGDGMVRIAPGEFLMGSQQGNPDERPVHRVRITRAFEMGRREVTQAQWETVMGEAHPRPESPLRNAQGAEVSRKPSHFAGAGLPVESVSWDDVQLFLQRLNDRELTHHYRLPTEAEWEYACRAGRTGGVAANASEAWCKENSDQQTHPVGEKSPNAWGLFDMMGNVAEWVEDWYARDYYEGTPLNDPAGPRGGTYRVFRGGSWLDATKDCRASFRGFDFPISRFYHVGFRVVRTLK
jgi:formylglycine-generating enzyme required for sulfatase activity